LIILVNPKKSPSAGAPPPDTRSGYILEKVQDSLLILKLLVDANYW